MNAELDPTNKTIESDDGKVPDYFVHWINTGADWVFMFTTVMLC